MGYQRPDPLRGPGRRGQGRADGGLHEPRLLEEDARGQEGLLLEPLAQEVLAEGRGIRQRAAGEEGFKTYPGAEYDKKSSEAASQVQSGTKVDVYTTDDSFDKVVTFYKDLYKEYKLNTHNANTQSLVLDGEKAIEHVMHNWDSFYKPLFDAQIFDKKLQDWKKSNPKQAASKPIKMYEKAYKKYDETPTDKLAYKNLVMKQQALNIEDSSISTTKDAS